MFCFTLPLLMAEETAEEGQKKSIVTPFFSFSNTSTLRASTDKDGVAAFNGFENEIDDMTLGLAIQVTDMFVISPYISNTVDFLALPGNAIHFNNDSLELGVGFGVTPLEFMTLDFGVAFNTKFNDFVAGTVSTGMIAKASLSFNIEEAHLKLVLTDTLNPMFAKIAADNILGMIDNDFEVELNFNFFNFVKEDLNSGLWIYNDFITDNFTDKDGLTHTDLENEFYAGLYFNPFEFFDAKVAFYGDFIAGFDKNNEVIKANDYAGLGLHFALGFYYKAVGLSVAYTPIVYSQRNGRVGENFDHTVEVAVKVTL